MRSIAHCGSVDIRRITTPATGRRVAFSYTSPATRPGAFDFGRAGRGGGTAVAWGCAAKPLRGSGLQPGDGAREQRLEPARGLAGDLLDLVVGERVGREPGAVVRDARHRAGPEAERGREVHLVCARHAGGVRAHGARHA